VAEVDPAHLPRHVAIIMDGNGRWAQRRGLKRTEGHAAGEEALFDTVDGALDLGLSWVTVYAFSTENWRRPLDEVRFLMTFNERRCSRVGRSCTSAACASASSVVAAAGCPRASAGASRRPRSSRAATAR
jgi:undecaprenyl diphosphate synthase